MGVRRRAARADSRPYDDGARNDGIDPCDRLHRMAGQEETDDHRHGDKRHPGASQRHRGAGQGAWPGGPPFRGGGAHHHRRRRLTAAAVARRRARDPLRGRARGAHHQEVQAHRLGLSSPEDDHRGPRRHHRRRRGDDHRRSLLGRERRADRQHGTSDQGRRRIDPARRGLQAAHLPLRVPRAGTPRARDPRHGARGDRHADHYRGHDPERHRRGRRSSPTSSRSAPATPRTTCCWKRLAKPASRSCSSVACRC